MAYVDFTTYPPGPLAPNPYPAGGMLFASPMLEIHAGSGPPNGLRFSDYWMLIDLDDLAAVAVLEFRVFNTVTIEALDAGGTPVAPPWTLPHAGGARSVAYFYTAEPRIRRLRVIGGGTETLLLSVFTNP
jgi:hypothetical protein